jgi:hypothetical protein
MLDEEQKLPKVEATWLDPEPGLPKNAYAVTCPVCEITLVEGLPEEQLDNLNNTACSCCGDPTHMFLLITTDCAAGCPARFEFILRRKKDAQPKELPVM